MANTTAMDEYMLWFVLLKQTSPPLGEMSRSLDASEKWRKREYSSEARSNASSVCQQGPLLAR